MEGSRRFPGLGDLGASVNPLRLLSQLAADLGSIRRHTISMDREVTGMHASVERIEVEMRELTSHIAELDERMASVESAVVRLEPYIADLNLALRPLRRARARFPNRPVAEQPAGAEPPAGDEEPPSEAAG
jgi:chromosome segregation ATPase